MTQMAWRGTKIAAVLLAAGMMSTHVQAQESASFDFVAYKAAYARPPARPVENRALAEIGRFLFWDVMRRIPGPTELFELDVTQSSQSTNSYTGQDVLKTRSRIRGAPKPQVTTLAQAQGNGAARTMSTIQDDLATRLALGVVADAPVSRMKPFSVSGVLFSPLKLREVAEKIKSGTINVKHDATLVDKASYGYNTNTLRLGFTSAQSIDSKALIIHEATHAALDMQKVTMQEGALESVCYLVQSQYWALMNVSPLKRWYAEGDPKLDAIFERASRIADKLLADKKAEVQEYALLRWAIDAYPEYKATAKDEIQMDGI
jgi:hypothetical protein